MSLSLAYLAEASIRSCSRCSRPIRALLLAPPKPASSCSISIPYQRSRASASRGLSTSSRRLFAPSLTNHESHSNNASSSKDPDHPYLHYHTFPSPPPGRTVLSFLPSPPVDRSRTVLGYLPVGAAGLGDLRENRDFMDVFHAAIRDGLEKGKAEAAEFEAAGRPGDGYIHITDERAIPPAGRIGETEDLIGSVFVQDGKLIASTYEPLPSYRLITANGPVLLPKGLDQHLIQHLERIDQEEKGAPK